MTTGVKITQIRLAADLYEAVREQAYEKRQSRNQFMSEAIREKIERIGKGNPVDSNRMKSEGVIY
jgi:metal-responsive CopG/Arc/MetJ family transcriptional regulator